MFTPNLTSELLVKGIKNALKSAKISSYLELGSGSGFVTIKAFEGIETRDLKLISTDIMPESKLIAEKNFFDAGIDVDVRVGSLFEPILDKEKFDFIVSDVAAISETVNEYLPWYENVPCATNENGLALFNQIVSGIKNYLKPQGKFIYPVVSLSCVTELEYNINKVFSNTKVLESKEWPLKITNPKFKLCLDSLAAKNYAFFVIRSGFYVFKTEIRISSL